jgi:hypothetical protein
VKTVAEFVFFDDRFPPEDWRDLLKAIEAGVREIMSPMEATSSQKFGDG